MNDKDLMITADQIAVCLAHFQQYIDEPALPATDFDYALSLYRNGVELRCARCEGEDDGERDQVASDFLRANRSAWGDGDRDRVESAAEVVSCFESYLRHPSHAA